MPFNFKAVALEPLYGLFSNSPFSLWIFTAPFLRKLRPVSNDTQPIMAGIAMYGVSVLLFILAYFYTTQRYAVDFSPWIMFLASFQYLRLLAITKSRWGFALLLAAGILMAGWGAFTGTMTGDCGILLQCDQKLS